MCPPQYMAPPMGASLPSSVVRPPISTPALSAATPPPRPVAVLLLTVHPLMEVRRPGGAIWRYTAPPSPPAARLTRKVQPTTSAATPYIDRAPPDVPATLLLNVYEWMDRVAPNTACMPPPKLLHGRERPDEEGGAVA